ncbi:hypothetical protein H5410_004312 [Solanum commersonii]|uniref:Uncharacterized protein n=1 Tax=Solanum commersonii TaxID=4109 RepID=A0A9J6B7M4_SOLCO|nr:hypothetical protein H5410_004312 [Solanum commersonii]
MKIVWQLSIIFENVKEFKFIVTNLDTATNNFIIRNYIPVHLYEKASRNYLCNSKFLTSILKME